MIIIIVRVLIAALLIWGVLRLTKFIIRKVVEKDMCPRCEGKGYWWGTREKEQCDMCFGTGKLQKFSEK